MAKLSITVALGTAKCPRSIWKLSSGFVAHFWQYFLNDAKPYIEDGIELDTDEAYSESSLMYIRNRYSATFSVEQKC